MSVLARAGREVLTRLLRITQDEHDDDALDGAETPMGHLPDLPQFLPVSSIARSTTNWRNSLYQTLPGGA